MAETAQVEQPHGRWALLAPILVVEAYLWFTIALFAWGPWDWIVDNPLELYGFITLAHLALLAGYMFGIRRPGAGYRGRTSIHSLIDIGVLVALLLFIPTNYSRTGRYLPDVVAGLENPGGAYDSFFDTNSPTPYAEYLRFFLGPLLALPVPLGVFYWSRLTRVQKIGVAVVVISIVSMYIGMGTNKAIADMMLIIPWTIAASAIARRTKLSRPALLGIMLGAVVAIGPAFSFFSIGMSTRGGGSSSVVNGVLSQVGAKVDRDHPMLRPLSQESQVGVAGLSMYLGVGYQGLSLCLEEPWVPTYGVGHSFFLTRQAERILGVNDLWKRTYPARIEHRGWDSFGLWSSVYPWFASDLTFPGAVIAVGLLGWLFARSWRDVLIGANPFAVVLFVELALMIFYFPGNNQLLQFGEGLSGFTFAVLAWARTRAAPALLTDSRVLV